MNAKQCKYIGTKQACTYFDTPPPNTIIKWTDDGLIDIVRNNTGNKYRHRIYDVYSFRT